MKALEFLKHNRDLFIEAKENYEEEETGDCDYEAIVTTLSEINEVIAELEAIQNNDRLAELEAVIRDYYLAEGYVVGEGSWGFQVSINSIYKWKQLTVFLYEGSVEIKKPIFRASALKTKDMFDRAFDFFTCKE